MKNILLVILCFLSLPSAAGWSFHSETIKDDENIIFFPAEAYPAGDGEHWLIRFHAWVFEPDIFGEINGVLHKVLGIRPDESKEKEKELFQQRAHWFVVDNERGKRIVIQLGDKQWKLAKTSANGHVLTTIKVPAALLQNHNKQGIPFRAVLRKRDKRIFRGYIRLVSEKGISVISDIDDTIKISNVTDKSELLANTFLLPFKVVEGLPEIYRRWQTTLGASFHYVSASPWQLYPPLASFIHEAGYPRGMFYMKYFRIKDSSFFNLFSDPVTYKTGIIETLFKRYPQRKFILVGDSGEKDPEVYGAIARKFPRQVLRILIRKVGNHNQADRFRKAFDAVPGERWMIFHNPEELGSLKFQIAGG